MPPNNGAIGDGLEGGERPGPKDIEGQTEATSMGIGAASGEEGTKRFGLDTPKDSFIARRL